MDEIEAWAARDKDGKLFLYLRKPEKKVGLWVMPDLGIDYIKLSSKSFPEVQWSDEEPTRVKITIEK